MSCVRSVKIRRPAPTMSLLDFCERVRMCSRGFTTLLRRILKEHRWPSAWKFHRLSPLFKKGAVHNADNYRGLHLTSVMSKVAERVLKVPFEKFVDVVDAFGQNQWAFRRGRGCPDLVLLLVCSWLRDFQLRRKVGNFLSDISGAFDRVDSEKLLYKMRRIGVCEDFLAFFRDYLRPRRALCWSERGDMWCHPLRHFP